MTPAQDPPSRTAPQTANTNNDVDLTKVTMPGASAVDSDEDLDTQSICIDLEGKTPAIRIDRAKDNTPLPPFEKVLVNALDWCKQLRISEIVREPLLEEIFRKERSKTDSQLLNQHVADVEPTGKPGTLRDQAINEAWALGQAYIISRMIDYDMLLLKATCKLDADKNWRDLVRRVKEFYISLANEDGSLLSQLLLREIEHENNSSETLCLQAMLQPFFTADERDSHRFFANMFYSAPPEISNLKSGLNMEPVEFLQSLAGPAQRLRAQRPIDVIHPQLEAVFKISMTTERLVNELEECMLLKPELTDKDLYFLLARLPQDPKLQRAGLHKEMNEELQAKHPGTELTKYSPERFDIDIMWRALKLIKRIERPAEFKETLSTIYAHIDEGYKGLNNPPSAKYLVALRELFHNLHSKLLNEQAQRHETQPTD